MIKVIKAEKPYKPEHGDLICEWSNEESIKYLTKFKKDTEKVVPLVIIYPNPWPALSALNIDYKELTAIYTCPYTDYKCYAIVPVALLMYGDVQYQVKHHSPEYVLDWEFHKQMWKEKRYEISDIQDLLLGSGYTDMTMANDGGGSKIPMKVMLDNGDALLVYTWEWHNK